MADGGRIEKAARTALSGCRSGLIFPAVLMGLLLLAAPALADPPFPSKPIEVVVPFPGGSSSTLTMNVIGEKMGEILGKPVVPINKPGGGTAVGTVFAAGAKPDGYTLLLGAGSFLTLPLTMSSQPYKVGAFTPIGRMTTNDFVLAVNNHIPVNTLKEFIAYAHKNAGKLSFVAGTAGSLPRLGGELLKDRAKIDAQYIPFQGMTQGVIALIGGHVHYGVMEAMPNLAHFRAKEMKALAIFSTKRDPHFPGVPTFVEEGYPDVITYTYFTLYTQARTPAPIVGKLESALKQTLQDKIVREKLDKIDETPNFLGSEETKAFMDSETKKWSEVIKKARLDFTE